MVAVPIYRQNCIRLWNLVSREDIGLLDQPGVPCGLVFSQEGGCLVAAGRRQAWLYPLSTPEKLNLHGHTAGVGWVAFSPGSARLASVADGVVRVSDALTGRTCWETNDLPGAGTCVSYNPNGQWLATGDWNTERVWIWDALTGQRSFEIGTNGPGMTWSLQFSPDGRYLATHTFPYGVRIWRFEPGEAS
jgi:WD40 repeat protein